MEANGAFLHCLKFGLIPRLSSGGLRQWRTHIFMDGLDCGRQFVVVGCQVVFSNIRRFVAHSLKFEAFAACNGAHHAPQQLTSSQLRCAKAAHSPPAAISEGFVCHCITHPHGFNFAGSNLGVSEPQALFPQAEITLRLQLLVAQPA